MCLGSLFSQATAADKRVNLILVGADMDRSRICVHYGGVAGGYPRHSVHGMPFAACGGWIEDVGAVTHDQPPFLAGFHFPRSHIQFLAIHLQVIIGNHIILCSWLCSFRNKPTAVGAC